MAKVAAAPDAAFSMATQGKNYLVQCKMLWDALT